MHKRLQKSKKENALTAVQVWQRMKVLQPVNPALRRIFQRPARIFPERRAGTAVLWSWSSGINVHNQKKIQWTPYNAFNNNNLQAAKSVSAPYSATGHQLGTCVWPALKNPSWLHCSYTTSAVPKALSTPPPHPPATRPSQVRKYGAKHRVTVNIAAASLLSLGTTEVFKQL